MRKLGSILALVFALVMISTVTIFDPADITRSILLKIIPERKIPQAESVIARVTFDAPIVPGKTTLQVGGVEDNAGNRVKKTKALPVHVQEELASAPKLIGSWGGLTPEGEARIILVFDHAMAKADVETASTFKVSAAGGAAKSPAKAVYDPATYEVALSFPKDAFKAGEEYTVAVAGAVTDVAATAMAADSTCKGTMGAVLAVPALQSARQDLKEDPEGKAVRLKFSAALDKTAAEKASSYSDENGKPADSAKLDADRTSVVVLFPHTMMPGESVVNAPNLSLADGKGWMRRIAAAPVAPGSEAPTKVLGVEAKTEPDATNDAVLITCDRPLLKADLEKVENYVLESPEGTKLELSGAKAAVDADDKTRCRVKLTLGSDNLKTGATFRLQLSSTLRDVCAHPVTGQLQFSGKVTGDVAPPKVKEVKQNLFVDPIGSTVDVVFEEAVDPATAETAANYKTGDGQVPTTVKVQSDGKMVRLSFVAALIPGETTLDVSNVQDLAGNTLQKAAGLRIIGDDQKSPRIIRSVAKSYPGPRNDVITITFSESLVPKDAEQIGNYTFEIEKTTDDSAQTGEVRYEKLDLSDCSISYNPERQTTTIVLDRRSNPIHLAVRKRYLISAANLRDLSGNKIDKGVVTKSEVEGDTVPPTISDATWDPKKDPDGKTILLRFSEPVDLRTVGDVKQVSVAGAGGLKAEAIESLPDGLGARVKLSGRAQMPAPVPATLVIVLVVIGGIYGLIAVGGLSDMARRLARGGILAAGIVVIVVMIRLKSGETLITIGNVRDLAGNLSRSVTSPSILKAKGTPPGVESALVFLPERSREFMASVTFTEPVLSGPAEDPANFTLSAPTGQTLTPAAGSFRYDPMTRTTFIQLKGAALKDNDTFSISVSGIRSLNEDPMTKPASQSGNVAGDMTPPKVLRAKQNLRLTEVALKDEIEEIRNIKGFPVGGNAVIDIEFSEPIDEDTAHNEGNFRGKDGQLARMSVLRTDQTTIRLLLANSPAVIPGETTLLVRNIKDLAGNPMEAVLDLPIQPESSDAPKMVTVQANSVPGVANDTIILSFNKKLVAKTATEKANYKVESPIGTELSLADASVGYNDPSSTVTITLAGKGEKAIDLTLDESFKVTASNIQDVSGNKIASGASLTGTIRGDSSRPEVKKIVQNIDCDPSGRTVDIQFDESIRWASAKDAQNYTASGGQAVAKTVVVDVPPPPVDHALVDARNTITDKETTDLIKTFSSFPSKGALKSRVPGYGGAEEAADFIVGKFKEYGLQPQREDFVVAVPVEQGESTVTLDSGERLRMFCLWPNHVRTSMLPPKGVAGPLIYAGDGEFRSCNGQDVEGSVVLMNFDSGQNLMNVRMLGASAILLFDNALGDEGKAFCEGEKKVPGHDPKALKSWLLGSDAVSFAEAEDKFIHVPADVPRFWVEKEAAKKLLSLANRGKKVELHAKMEWQRVKATNICATLGGSDEEMPPVAGEKPKKWSDNRIVLEAYYDSMSVVPAIAPGAENACSIASLLQIARVLAKERPPKYKVTFLATSAHFEGLSGIYQWLYRHSRNKSNFYNACLAEKDKVDFQLFLGLDLSSQTDQVAAFSEGTFTNWWYGTDNYKMNALSPIAKKFLDYYEEVYPPVGDEVSKAKSRDLNYLETRGFLNAVTPSKRSWRHYMKTDLALDNEAVTWVGHFGVALATAHDRRKYVDTPMDTLDRLNIANVTKQTQIVASLLLKACKDPAFFPDTKLKFKDYGHSMKGNVYLFDRNVNFFVPKAPVGNALVTYYFGRPKSRAGVRTLMVAMTQPDSPSGGNEKQGYAVENVTADGGRVRVKIWDRQIVRDGKANPAEKAQYDEDRKKVKEAKVVAATRYGTFEYPLYDWDRDGVFEAIINLNREIRSVWSIVWAGVACGVLLLLCLTMGYALREKPARVKAVLRTIAIVAVVLFGAWSGYVYIWHIAGDPRLPRQGADGKVHKDDLDRNWDDKSLPQIVLAGQDKKYEVHDVDVSYGAFKGQFLFDIRRHRWTIWTRCHELDKEGRIVKVSDLGQEGDKTYPQVIPYGWWETNLLGVVFPCRALSIFETVDSRYLSALDYATLLGADDAAPQWWCVDSIYGQSRDEGKTTDVAVVYAKPGTRVKVLMSTSMFGVKYLLTNAPKQYFDQPVSAITETIKKEALGLGYPINDGIIPRPAYEGTRDMWILDDVRMKELAKYSVRNDKLDFRPVDPKDPTYIALKQAEDLAAKGEAEKAYEQRQVAKQDERLGLHVRSKLSLDDAKYFLEKKQYEKFVTATREGWGLEARGYPDVKATANDTVKGIVFYFMLLLPFSFFGERLICGTPNVYKRIAVFAAIFFSVFIVLRYVHPAFKLSPSPYIIFLGFVIFALGAIVLFFVLSKFNQEVQKIKRASSGIHEVDVGRLSATLAAVLLGISNLRKRPLRTGLTATTLILLTFTVLSFTSVKTGLHFYKLPRKNKPPFQGALIRDRSWKGLQPSVLKYLKSAFKPVAHVVAPRAWRMARKTDEKEYIKLVNVANGKPTYPNAVVGFTPEEVDVTGIDQYLIGEHSRWFKPDDRYVCIMPSDMAALVDIKPEGLTPDDAHKPKISMHGQEFTVIGIIDSERFNRTFDMDDEKLTPVDTVSEGQRMQEEKSENPDLLAAEPIETFVHLESSNVILAPYEYVMANDGLLRSVAITNFKNPKFVRDIEDFMRRVALTVFVGEGDRVVVYSSIGRTSLGGVSNLLVPILIAALIVMNTMMGAVYERFREIGIYSSVGLAPNHIAALFLAESAVFATVGAVMGYLLGQIITLLLSHYGLLKGMNLNYSSLSAIWSTVVVMLTVFLSALYPSKRAADMAVPDVTRKWKFPEPQGDTWTFDFPFTVGGAEIVGMYAYLARVFESYGEGSTGGFVAEGVELRRAAAETKAEFRIRMRTWLAPYDLGISQDVTLDAIPTGEHDIYKVEVTLHRLSGDVASWRRINRGFLNVLRKRFLVWRTVDQGEKQAYRQTGMEKLGIAPAPATGE